MFTFGNGSGEHILSTESQFVITDKKLRLNSTNELLRLRGKYVNNHPEIDIIQAEINRRQYWECSAYTILIAGAVVLIIVLV